MPVQFKDYYETLGVKRDTPQDDIRKAFRKLAREYHPDVAKDKSTAEAKFKEINEAYEVLGDPEKRKKYDELGANWDQQGGFQPPPGWRGTPQGGMPGGGVEFEFGGTGFSDFFEAFFGGGRGGFSTQGGGIDLEELLSQQRGSRVARPRAGRDIETSILVTLEEVLNGSTRIVTLGRPGRVDTERLTVKIPPGIAENEKIRLRGKGEAGRNGGEPGDLYMIVRLAQHPDFDVHGSDLFADVTLPVSAAVLGTQASVRSLHGTLKIKIPPGSQPGKKLRLRGKGLPRRKGEAGDLIVTIHVQLPEQLSAEQRRHWEKMAEIGH